MVTVGWLRTRSSFGGGGGGGQPAVVVTMDNKTATGSDQLLGG